MLKLATLYSIALAMMGFSFWWVSTQSPPEPPTALDYEEIGFCFWERYDPAALVSETTSDVRFCIEVYPHSYRP